MNSFPAFLFLLLSGFSFVPVLSQPLLSPAQKAESPYIQYTYPPTSEWEPVDSKNYYNSGLEDCRFKEIKFPFYSKDGEVFFSNEITDKERLEGVKIENFEPLEGDYGRTNERVYYGSRILEGAEAASFTSPFFRKYGKSWEPSHTARSDLPFLRYGADSNALYLEGEKVAEVDGASAELVLDSDWSFVFKDKNHVFFYHEPIPNADPDSFRLLLSDQDSNHLSIHLLADKNHLYYLYNRVMGNSSLIRLNARHVDLGSFQLLTPEKGMIGEGSLIGKDKGHYYYLGKSLGSLGEDMEEYRLAAEAEKR